MIPAKSDDRHIALTKATAGQTGMVNDQLGNGHFYVAWTQVFSAPAGNDGIYVKDVTSGAMRKAPGTGTFTANTGFPVFARLPIVNRNLNNAQRKNEQFVTQVLAGLTPGFPGTVAGRVAITNAAGQASIKLSASIKPGRYKVTVTAPSYLTATGSLTVRK